VNSTNSSVFSQKLKEFYWTVTRAVGLGFLHDGSRNNHRNGLLRLLFYPLYAVAARVLSYAGVRFLDAPFLMLERVGHLAMDFDSYLKDQLLAHRKVIPVLLCAGRTPSNEALLAHWSQHVRVIRSRWICWLLRPLMSFPEVVDSLLGYCMVGWQAFAQDAPNDFALRRGACRTHYVQSLWADRAPIICLSEDEIARGEAELRVLGIPEGACSSAFTHAKAAIHQATSGSTHSATRISQITQTPCVRSWRAAAGAFALAIRQCGRSIRCLASSITPGHHRKATGWICFFAHAAVSFSAIPRGYSVWRDLR